MKRDLAQLMERRFDLLIVGGGIYGATLAAEAAASGLCVALIEQQDFGHATSANSQKVIHGGLRYLQHFDFKRMRESIRSRRRLLTIAPHLVSPLKFVIPTHGVGLRSRVTMRAALTLNDIVAADRNRGVGLHHTIPRSYTIGRSECLKMIPGLEFARVTGGAVWHDAIVANTERLCLSFIKSASRRGAVVANHIRAVGLVASNSSEQRITAEDLLNGERIEIRARTIVNTLGPWSAAQQDPVGAAYPSAPNRGWARAVNVVVSRRIFDGYAVGLSAGRFIDEDALLDKGSRDYFFVPWMGRTIIGTFYDRLSRPAEEPYIRAAEIERIVADINRAYPPACLDPSEISFVHAGFLPMRPSRSASDSIQLVKHSSVIPSARSGERPRVFSVVGTKYTTASETARQVLRVVLEAVERSYPTAAKATDAETERVVDPDEAMLRWESYLPVSLRDVIDTRKLAGRYGPDSESLADSFDLSASRELINDDPAAEPVLLGEVIYAMRQEMAETLADTVFRRLPLACAAHPGRKALARCAAIMAEEKGWSEQRVRSELEHVERTFESLPWIDQAKAAHL